MFALCIESSHERGMGHLYRMLNFSMTLKESNIPFKFYVNDDEVAMNLLRYHNLGFSIVPLRDFCSEWEKEIVKNDAITLWINDRLNTEVGHAERVKREGIPLVTFDDRGSGASVSDLNIAALAFENVNLLEGKKVLHGVDYLILNPEISNFSKLRTRIDSIIITMGGSDTHGVTLKVAKHLLSRNLKATIILGPSFSHHKELEEISSTVKILHGVPSLIEEFSRHDLAITGGGVTPFEACASGLPCIVIANEDFEVQNGRALERMGSSYFAGHHSQVDLSILDCEIDIESMSRIGMEKVSLNGRQRVLKEILELK